MIKFEIIQGDITTSKCEAIVNAANSRLQVGGGVCGCIFSAAGSYELQKECNSIGHCDTGNAVITKGYNLNAQYVIHAVGPRYGYDKDYNELLYSAYYKSLELANNNKIKSIAFPLISTGIFGYRGTDEEIKNKAYLIAVDAINNYINKNVSSTLEKIVFYAYDQETYDRMIKISNNYIKNSN